jgi:hypothetical protein
MPLQSQEALAAVPVAVEHFYSKARQAFPLYAFGRFLLPQSPQCNPEEVVALSMAEALLRFSLLVQVPFKAMEMSGLHTVAAVAVEPILSEEQRLLAELD